ncbi:MAG: metalloregulator ArsR/SmtB family transcription factor [Alcaligenaceae bacterium]|nr:metalloregulator ArsR/SmtB family transcription factor [Alcaligenaceae bacterium]
MDKQKAVTMFDSLASEIRLDIVKLLLKFGDDGLVAGEIAADLDIPSTNLSFHLKNLVHAGLLQSEQEGRYQRYRVDLPTLIDLSTFLMEKCCALQSDKSAKHLLSS